MFAEAAVKIEPPSQNTRVRERSMVVRGNRLLTEPVRTMAAKSERFGLKVDRLYGFRS